MRDRVCAQQQSAQGQEEEKASERMTDRSRGTCGLCKAQLIS
jgi:hypothetical protein